MRRQHRRDILAHIPLARVRRAEDAGVPAIASDIDAAGIIHMKRAGQPTGLWSLKHWEKVISETRLPIILKGIMTALEAKSELSSESSRGRGRYCRLVGLCRLQEMLQRARKIRGRFD